MTLTKSFPTQDPAGLPITDTRRVLAGLITRNADGTPRPGVLPVSTSPIVSGRASMAYDVAAFVAVTSRLNTGVELVANDAVTQVATDPAPNANSRIDVIYVRSQFLQHADGSNLAVLAVAKGVAAAIPQKPAIPAGALELGWAEVPSTATTTQSNGVVITQSAPFTTTAGGVVPFRNATELLAWVAPNGVLARDLATGDLYERKAGAWQSTQTGSNLIVPNSVSGTGLSIVNGEVVATNMPTAGGNIEGIFSPRFRNYEIEMEGTFSVGSAIQMRLRNAGGTSGAGGAGTDYLNQYIWATVNGAAQTTQNNISLFAQSAAGGDRMTSRLKLTNPAQAIATGYLAECASRVANNVTQTRIAGFHNPAVAYTGIEITTTSGAAFTGTIRIYGVA